MRKIDRLVQAAYAYIDKYYTDEEPEHEEVNLTSNYKGREGQIIVCVTDEGNVIEYSDVNEASLKLGLTKDTVWARISNKTKRDGYTLHYKKKVNHEEAI